MTDEDSPNGLSQKYQVTKNGEEQDACFVLKPESDPAARRALLEYARATDNPELAADLRFWVSEIEVDAYD